MPTKNKSSLIGWTTLFGILAVLGLVTGVYFNFKAVNTKKQAETFGKQYLVAQKKLSDLTRQNNQVIYMPNAKDLYLSPRQSASVKTLNQIFTNATNYASLYQYQGYYNDAKKVILDKQFYQQFMRTPNQISVMQLFLSNVRTQVLVVGDNKYEVLVSYIPYHNSSDLYQSANLEVVTRAFVVKGYENHFDYARLDSQLITQGPVVYASQFN